MSACLVGQPAALDDGEWCAAETLADARFHSISGELARRLRPRTLSFATPSPERERAQCQSC